MSNLISRPFHDFEWFVDLIFAFLLNLFATGIFAFVGFAFPTNRLLPKRYYRIHQPEAVAWWYDLLGVPIFRKFLMITFWGKEKNRKKYFNGTRTGIRNFVYQTKQSEFGHLAAFMLIGILIIILVFHQFYQMAFMASVINMIGNLYPIILQRHHRMRLGKLADLD
jgi:hypothetical protein